MRKNCWELNPAMTLCQAKRQAVERRQQDPERRVPPAVEEAYAEEKDADGDQTRHGGVYGGLEPLVPLAVGGGEAEIDEL